MKSLVNYISERLVINKDYKDALIASKSFDELRKIIEDRYNELGPGTKNDPIDFNDVDVSNIDSFYNKKIMKEYLKAQNLNTLMYQNVMLQMLTI